MKHNIKNENGDKLQINQNLLNEILNAEPYCDFWSAKIRVMKYLNENYPDDFKNINCLGGRFLIDTLACLLDHVSYEKDLELLNNEKI
jgi:hypothetical protein